MRLAEQKYFLLRSLAKQEGDPFSTAMPDALEAMREDTKEVLPEGRARMAGATALWERITTLTGESTTNDNGGYGVKRLEPGKVIVRGIAPHELQVLSDPRVVLIRTIAVEHDTDGAFRTKIFFRAFQRTIASDFEPVESHPVEEATLSAAFGPDSVSQLEGVRVLAALSQATAAADAFRTVRS